MAYSLDRSLHEAALAGEPSALDRLVRDLRPHIERQLLRYPVAEEDRSDLAQATLVQVIRRLGSFRGDSSFSTWLFRVTANEALMLMRSQRRQRARIVGGMDWEELSQLPALRDGTTRGADVETEDLERESCVRRALDELPEDYRAVVVAHYHQELGLQEIADKMSLTESAVRSRLHRARARLRTLLEDSPVGRELAEAFGARAPAALAAA